MGGRARIVETDRHPLVVGSVVASERTGRGQAPTVMVYGHVDVQPAGVLTEWESPPFDAEVRDGWLYGRGTADDKGNLYLLLKAVELLAREGSLPVDVEIVCDAEEEILGTSVCDFVERLDRPIDACLIFDAPMIDRNLPAFIIGGRGLVYFNARIRTGERALHSGLYGGAALNAAHVLIDALGAVVAGRGELSIGAQRPGDDERDAWSLLEDGNQVLGNSGAAPSDSGAGAEFYARTLGLPALDVNAITCGNALEQSNSVPAEAVANVSVRLVPGQDPEAVTERLEALLRSTLPPGATLTLNRWSAVEASLISADAPALQVALEAFERVLGRRPPCLRTGGSLPILNALARKEVPVILTGFAPPESNVHSVNERLLLSHIPIGIVAAREVLMSLGERRLGESREREE
jgi:acetylornithine deacetylase/succinyl-diaminopimelate desuccinylase-like protein